MIADKTEEQLQAHYHSHRHLWEGGKTMRSWMRILIKSPLLTLIAIGLIISVIALTQNILLVAPVVAIAFCGMFLVPFLQGRFGYDDNYERMWREACRLAGDFIYGETSGIGQKTIEQSKLFLQTVEINDKVKGISGNEIMKFCTATYKIGQRSSEQIIVANIFIQIPFNKAFKGETIVTAKNKSAIDAFITRVSLLGRAEIKLENPGFNESFRVYGTDQVEARYILSPAMMQMMLTAEQYLNAEIAFSFINHSMFIRYLVPGQLKFDDTRLPGYDDFKAMYQYVKVPVKVVEYFHLDRKIWG